MFKERLKIFFIELLKILPVFLLGLTLISILISIPHLINIIAWVVVIAFSIILIMVICIFVNWLFIEPYKNWKNNKKEKDL